MTKMVSLTIDGKSITVPDDMVVVDAARKLGIVIPVFCHHPKIQPAGMCRMCLVDIGRPVIDRTTGEAIRETDGSLKIQFTPKLETSCTTLVSEGMLVITDSQKVKDARREVLEFLLTSHPLDCPVCDKGGECPLQNLTIGFGPGQSRFDYDEKMHLGKHIALGDLIFLDRERCIQCARCIRFQNEVVDDAVIAFSQRGRALQITTHSDPGFDSVFSGNTTDICPVGALTTADFRFGARSWELESVASLCNHCPVGCNIVFNIRREARSGGSSVIKRVMPRQNEAVNELWICDKGRFAYHYVESKERLVRPLVRKDGNLVEASWDVALDVVAKKLIAYGASLVTLAGGRLSNEDLFNLYHLTHTQGGKAVLYSFMAGGDLVSQVGVGKGTNLNQMGKGSVILVAATDLYEEAPLWWLRVKAAAERGAELIMVNPRPTRLDKFASYILRYDYGSEADALRTFLPENSASLPEEARAAVKAFQDAENVVLFFGSEGLGLAGSAELAHTCAELLVRTSHNGRPNNGLIGVWHSGNIQGAWDMGFRPVEDLAETLQNPGVTYIAAADPAGDDPFLAAALKQSRFLVVQDILLTETAKMADVVLPAQAYSEREGTYTSGERRLQRFYPAALAPAGSRPDFSITAQVSHLLGRLDVEASSAGRVLRQIAALVPAYAGLDYQKLAETPDQWPQVGRGDLYYGGTAYENHQGVGVQLASGADRGEAIIPVTWQASPAPQPVDGLLVVPVTRLYDRSSLLVHSDLLKDRLAKPVLSMHPETGSHYNLTNGQAVQFEIDGQMYQVVVWLDETLPLNKAILPRSVGVPLAGPVVIDIQPLPTGAHSPD
jgi:NADH-quinone oxidoreductase subunit G